MKEILLIREYEGEKFKELFLIELKSENFI